jgi:DNA-binding transcriptional LysR family regulator
MAGHDVNRSGEMAIFVQAVELGGFSAAARALRMTPSAVSKLVARLEKRLGARLIHRSTRKLLLTAEGQTFLSARSASCRIWTRPSARWLWVPSRVAWCGSIATSLSVCTACCR